MRKISPVILFIFLILLTPSFAFSHEEIISMFHNENYTTMSVEIPEFLHQPKSWLNVYNDVSKVKKYSISRISSLGLGNFQKYKTKSITEIAEEYGGYVYGGNPEYSYANIIIHNKSYKKLTNIFKSLGFKVILSPNAEPLLSESKNAIELPYIYPMGEGDYELTGEGRTIAIIDSGVDGSHEDFIVSGSVFNKIVFWNDTTNEYWNYGNPICYDYNPGHEEDCIVDQHGHGTHVCSIAAGTGTASSTYDYSGVARDAHLMVWKVELGNRWGIDWIAEANRQAVRQNPDVISMSLGIDENRMEEEFGLTMQQACSGGATGLIQDWYEAIISGFNSGIPIVVSAGNSGPDSNTITFPACIQGVISVGSTLKMDYSDQYYPYNQDGSEFRVNTEINISTDNPPTIFNYDWFTNFYGKSGYKKVVSPVNWPATINVKVEGQNLDWCKDNTVGDLTVACVNTIPLTYQTRVIECGGDCRDKNWSPDSICQDVYGNGWYASSVDCELINIKNIPNGDYIRRFNNMWAGNEKGWCQDSGGEDMTVTCTYTDTPPNYRVLVRECGGNCDNEGTPNNICTTTLGSNWYAINVDCENINIGVEENVNRSFDDNVGSWCHDGGGEDITITCAEGSPTTNYKVRVIECGVNGEGCKNEGIPNEICQDAYGDEWYASSVDCEVIEVPNMNKDWNRKFNNLKTFNLGPYIGISVFKPSADSINSVVVKEYRVSALSTEGLLSFFSSRGSAPQEPFLIQPVVTAPGQNICAANASQGYRGTDNCGDVDYVMMSGTSMAAPHVSGLVALLREGNPSSNFDQVTNALIRAEEKLYIGDPDNNEGYGRIDVQKAVDFITDCDLKYPEGGYSDFSVLQCSNYNYESYSSANQIRDYYWLDPSNDCDCDVDFDSYITRSVVNDVESGDTEVSFTDNIVIDIDVENTGTTKQNDWYLGVEFWKVPDYTDPLNGRHDSINSFYDGSIEDGGCFGANCPSGVDCSIISESVNTNQDLDVGETIRVRCQVPASFYDSTTGTERIMFWVHEMDLGQDADNDGNVGEWWDDALSRVEPADVRVKILDIDGGYSDSTINPPKCQNYNYVDYTSANQIRDYYFDSELTCDVDFDSYITNVCVNNKCENYDNPILYYKFDEGRDSVVHDSSENGYDGTLREPDPIDDFEDGDYDGWTLSCGGDTSGEILSGYGSEYAFSIKSNGGSGTACAYKTIDVTENDRISYVCKGYGCKMCVWNGTNCINSDSSYHGYVSGWRVFSSLITRTQNNVDLHIYNDGQVGHGATYDFITKGSIWIDGKREKAIAFRHGLDYIEVPHDLDFNNISIEAWVRIDPFSEPRYFIIASKTGEAWNAPDTDYDYKYTITPVAEHIKFAYRYSAGGSKCSKGYTKNITDGKWHHIAVSFDSDNNKVIFYTDGNKSHETDGCGPIVLSDDPTRIGQMIGDLDEVRIYDRVIDYEDPKVDYFEDIVVDVDVKNTGTDRQNWWHLGVEFWKVNDYTDPRNTRSQRVDTFYNGKDEIGNDCSIISESVNTNQDLDVGETIRVRCQVPASFYDSTTGTERIMFWVHEMDLGQDADNDGNVGEWWDDALSRVEPADVRVNYICLGDINNDGRIDMRDVAAVARKFGCNDGQDCYDSICDINNDGRIDMRDVAVVSRRFGDQCY